jgi:putative protease
MSNTPPTSDVVTELMAPAGDWAALQAAVANGADAVYFGLDNFNARHRAENFTTTELPEVMRYIHDHNVRGYVTFNTLIFSEELPSAATYARALVDAGVDAVIVQDWGLVRLLRTMAPQLAIHGSTQMTLTEPRGLNLAQRWGVCRAVLARELAITDIRKIREASTLPVEVFIHGALCVAYSGQCLTSESIGGRSANRGQCAQACRLPYDLIVDGQMRDLGDVAYLVSPQDLAGYDQVADLVKLGVQSLKIEGRLKSSHYVAATTRTYRSALDAAQQHIPFQIPQAALEELTLSFSRGFAPGFLTGVNHQQLVQGRFPKARGQRLGVVVNKTEEGLQIRLDDPHLLGSIKPGDGIVLDEGHPDQDEQGGRVFEVFPQRAGMVELRLGRNDLQLAAVAIGAIVWKTDDPALKRRLEQTYARDTIVRPIPVTATVQAHVGQPLQVTLHLRELSATATAPAPLVQANKHPVTLESVREQLARLGDTPFTLADVSLQTTGGPMVPKSLLNDLRRQAAAGLHEAYLKTKLIPVVCPDALSVLRARISASDQYAPLRELPAQTQLHVMVRTPAQLQGVIDWNLTHHGVASVTCDFEDVRNYKAAVTLARTAGLPIGLATLRIIKPGEDGLLRVIGQAAPDFVMVRNLAGLDLFQQEFPNLPLQGDYSLNVSNELTAYEFYQAGLQRLVPSHDLNLRQLQALLKNIWPGAFELVIHQHMPMFHMEHCVFAHTMSEGKDYRDCGRPCDTHKVELRDRTGQAHPLLPDTGCRNTLFNAQAQSAIEFLPRLQSWGLRHFRIELLRESGPQIGRLLDEYHAALLGQRPTGQVVHNLQVVSGFGVTLGTLEHE